MLNYFRHHSLRKSLWLIILFGSLFIQSQNLFACNLMDNGPQTSCCCDEDMSNGCPMGGGCTTSDDGVFSGCCDTSTVVDAGLQDLTISDSNHSKQVQSLDAPQPPPVLILTTHLLLPLTQVNNNIPINYFTRPEPTSGTSTYQITNRFRI